MAATPASSSPSPDHVDLSRVARGVAGKLPVIALLAGLGGAATAGVLMTMAPKYLSQAQLEVRGGGVETGGQPDKEAVGTHVRALSSTELALKMAKSLKLADNPEFNSRLEPIDLYGRLWRKIGVGGPKPEETDEDRVLQALSKSVRAYQVRETRSIIVDCTTSVAKFSAQCANTLVDLYRESLSGRVVTESSDIRSKLAPQVERLTQETAEAEAMAAEFRGKANLFQGGAQATGLKDQQLSELTQEMTRAAAARSEAEARASSAREMAARGMAAASPDVQKSALVPRMEEQRVALERQISELSATLLSGHPRMKQLTSELAGLKAQINAEVTKVVESLGNDAKIAAEREASLRRRIDEMKKTVVTSVPDTAKLAQLENQAKAKRAELERVQRQYEAAASSANAAVSPPEIKIVSQAFPSNEKIFPKVGSMSALAAFATFILALAGTLTRELVRGARPVAASKPEAAAMAVAAAEPVLPMRAQSKAMAEVTPDEPKAATPQQVATRLATLAQEARGFRVMTAPGTAAARTETEALALGRALGASGKRVIVVGWAGSGDALAIVAGVDGRVGTAQLLAGDASLEDAIQSTAGDGLAVIVAGAGESSMVDGDSAALVLDTLDESYDFIVVCGTAEIETQLFQAVQGRFDAGVVVTDQVAPPMTFLGFEVPDFPILAMTAMRASAAQSRRPAMGVRKPLTGAARAV